MRREASPGLYLPSRIALNSAIDSSMGRERCVQGSRMLVRTPLISSPLCALISASSLSSALSATRMEEYVLEQWQMYAPSLRIKPSASSYNRSKLSLAFVKRSGLNPSHETISSIETKYFCSSPEGLVSSNRSMQSPPWNFAKPKLMAIALLCPM
jgi:hypothetical protein